MISIKISKIDFATERTTPYNRAVGLAFGIMNIPGLIAGAIFTVLGMGMPLILFVPGTLLFTQYWKIYKDKVTRKRSIGTWHATQIFNFLLMVLTIITLKEAPAILMVGFGFQAMAIFVAETAIMDLKKPEA